MPESDQDQRGVAVAITAASMARPTRGFDTVDHSVVFRHVVEPRLPIGRVRYDQIANANATRRESLSIETAITARSALEVSISRMGGDNLIAKASMPGLWQGNGSHADCAR